MSEMAAEVHSIMQEVNLRPGSFFLGGSAGLALRGIRPIGGDIDVGIPTRLWMDLYTHSALASVRQRPTWTLFTTDPHDERRRCDPPYLYREVQGKQVHLFFSWRWRGLGETEYNDFNLAFREGTEIVHYVDEGDRSRIYGYPCLKLPLLMRQKVDAIGHETGVREKDIVDVGLIADALWAERFGA